MSYCNDIIHDYLKDETNYFYCPFCGDYKLHETQNIKKYKCCDKMKLINNNGTMVCQICGIITYYEYCNEYIDFYEKKYKFRGKTIYNRYYHVQHILNSYDKKQFTYHTRDKKFNIFKKIDIIQEEVNNNRKRMISIHYIIRCIFKTMNLEYKFIDLPKSKKTLQHYKSWWRNVLGLIGQEIYDIIQK